MEVLGLAIAVQVQEGVVVVLDHDVSFGAHFLREHLVLLREAFVQELEASRDLTMQEIAQKNR